MQALFRLRWWTAALLLAGGCRSEQAAFSFRPAPALSNPALVIGNLAAATTAPADTQNPNPKLRSRPRLGMVFMQGFEYDEDNKWDDGKIYDPETGKTYSCYIKMENANTMEVKGYIGFSLIGKSQTWTRVK
ncbi:DUF2147 domain-containing protein [Hymenobacter amundsenii]|uniref:DUF2147 domain-containing protein n=1 Tax=Hymenobacter amundsenii TaxID=2006685 RepID=UPI001F5C092E|nr:DUF2147 domain-containing protein [Hymenobacter amundsenii]